MCWTMREVGDGVCICEWMAASSSNRLTNPLLNCERGIGDSDSQTTPRDDVGPFCMWSSLFGLLLDLSLLGSECVVFDGAGVCRVVDGDKEFVVVVFLFALMEDRTISLSTDRHSWNLAGESIPDSVDNRDELCTDTGVAM